MKSWLRARSACAASISLATLIGVRVVAAQAPADSARCDSIVQAKDAVVDSNATAVFLSVARVLARRWELA